MTVEFDLKLSSLVDLRHRQHILAHARHKQRVLNFDGALFTIGQNHQFHDGSHTLDCSLAAIGHRQLAFVPLVEGRELGLVVADVA